jgi:hypothetical protein
MGHTPAARARARRLYLDGWGPSEIATRTGVGRATISRWATEGGWRETRARRSELEAEAGRLTVDLVRQARGSGDPQQAYAALHAAELGGLAAPAPEHPAPRVVARALIGVLAQDDELGPILRRRRQEIAERVAAEVERLEAAAPA